MKTVELVKDLSEYPSETEWLEFKENYSGLNEIGEYISAISNAAAVCGRKEGYLIWGVRNGDHKIIGTDFQYNKDINNNEPFQNFLARQLSPSISFKFEEGEIEDRRFVILHIPSATKVPTAWQEKRYGRIGSSKVNLAKYPEREAELWDALKHGVPNIVNTPAPDQTLTFRKLLLYYAAKGLELREDSFENNLHLRTDEGKYNILAMLVADNGNIPVRFAIFDGLTKADRMYSVKEFGNDCLFYVIDRVMDYGSVLNIPQADERNRKGSRIDVPLFDQSAFNEAVINAFIHNDWLHMNAPMFTAYQDRIEILSHGGLPAEQTMEGFFRGDSRPRCPELARMFIQLHISEATGRGVPRIVKAYGKSAYEFGDGFIVTTLTYNRINTVVEDEVVEEPEDAYMVLSDGQKKILLELQKNPSLTIDELMRICNLSHSGVAKNLNTLKSKGILERRGNRRSGYWKINKW